MKYFRSWRCWFKREKEQPENQDALNEIQASLARIIKRGLSDGKRMAEFERSVLKAIRALSSAEVGPSKDVEEGVKRAETYRKIAETYRKIESKQLIEKLNAIVEEQREMKSWMKMAANYHNKDVQAREGAAQKYHTELLRCIEVTIARHMQEAAKSKSPKKEKAANA